MAIHSSEDFYSLLNVARDATQEEIHRAYKKLSTTFHPDKLPPSAAQNKEKVEEIFLQFKLASKSTIEIIFWFIASN